MTARTCATHNPGSPDCGPNCPDQLRSPDATPGLVFATAGGFVGAPADIERAKQMQMGSDFLGASIGPQTVEEMAEAAADVGPIHNTPEQDEQALVDVTRAIEGDAAAANLTLCMEENERLKARILAVETHNRRLHNELQNARATIADLTRRLAKAQ